MGKTVQNPSTKHRTCILILGMHRSGTSALAGCMNLLGFYPGKNLIPPNESNIKGYFENNLLYHFNDHILDILYARWNDTLALPDNWWKDKMVINEHDRLKEIINTEFETDSNFLIKDPRISVLLPLYLDVFEQEKISPKIIINYRNPYEVADSLEYRDNLSKTKSFLLWMDAIFKSELFSRNHPRIFINYSSLLSDPVFVADTVVKHFKLKVETDDQINIKIKQFIDKNLRSKHKKIYPDDHYRKHINQLFNLLQECNLHDTNSVNQKKFDELRTSFYSNFNFYNGLEDDNTITLKVFYRDEKQIVTSVVQYGMNNIVFSLNTDKSVFAFWIYPFKGKVALKLHKIKIITTEGEVSSYYMSKQNAEFRLDSGVMIFDSESPQMRFKLKEPLKIAQITCTVQYLAFSQNVYRASIKERTNYEKRLLMNIDELKKLNDKIIEDSNKKLLQQNTLNVQFKKETDVQAKKLEDALVEISKLEKEANQNTIELEKALVEISRLEKEANQNTIQLKKALSEVSRLEKEIITNNKWIDELTKLITEAKILKEEIKVISEQQKKNEEFSNFNNNKIRKINNYIYSVRDYISIDKQKKQNGLKSELYKKTISKLLNKYSIFYLLKVVRSLYGIKTSGLFDKEYYLTKNPDVKNAKVNPLKHYLFHGGFEGRNPSASFNSNLYLKRYPDVKAAGINPLVHYIIAGKNEGREITPLPAKPQKNNKKTEEQKSEPQKNIKNKKLVPVDIIPDIYDVSKRVINYWENKKSNNKIVVYTAIIGDYDVLKIPECLNPEIDYVCFTDQYFTGYNPWEIRYPDYYDKDPTKISRYYKLNPHIIFPEYETVIWVDATLLIRKGNDFKELIQKHIESGKIISTSKHPDRNCVYEEAKSCEKYYKDSSEKIQKQTNLFKDIGLPDDFGLAETMLLISNPNNPETIQFFNEWWQQILRFTKRDQIALPYVMYKTGKKFNNLFGSQYNYRFDKKYFQYFLHKNLINKEVPYRYFYPVLKEEKFIKANIQPLINNDNSNTNYFNILNNITVDIILPVYNALYDVKKCINSIIPTLSDGKIQLIIVNDSSEKETTDYLQQVSKQSKRIILIENEKNLGYTKTVNIGLRYSDSDYKIVLNSDTIVPKNWIKKLIACGESSKHIGIVGPLSNAASWQTVPVLTENGKFKINELPENITVEDADKICDKFTFNSYPKVSLLNGFCYAIKKEVLDTIGYLDENAFPMGYGEEDDFSLRAQNAGFLLAVAINTYVFHAKSKSFGTSKRNELSKKGGLVLKERHGEERIKESCDSLKENPYINAARKLFLSATLSENSFSRKQPVGLLLQSLQDKVNFSASSYIRFILPYRAKNISSIFFTKDILLNQKNIIPFVVKQLNINIKEFDSVLNITTSLFKSGLQVSYDIDFYISQRNFNNSKADVANKLYQQFKIFRSITTSSALLTEHLKKLLNREDVVTVTNKLDEELWFRNTSPEERFNTKKPKSKPNKSYKILYMGMYGNTADVLLLKPVINEIKKTYKDVEFYCIGGVEEDIDFMIKIIPPSQAYPDFVKWFLNTVKQYKFDFALAPSAENINNKYKSYIKYLDYSACFLPAVYSNKKNYRLVVKNKVTGLLAGSPEEWVEAIKHMINNPAMRTKLVNNAYNNVYFNHTNLKNDNIINAVDLNKIDFKLIENNGEHNIIEIDKNSNLIKPKIVINGNGNKIRIGPALRNSNLTINLEGNNKTIFINKSKKYIKNLSIQSTRGDEQFLLIDNDFGCGSAEIIMSDGGEKIIIGKDCLFASEIKLRANDGHSVIDLEHNVAINPAGNIFIGDHCWVGDGVKFLKDSAIKENTVVGAYSVVTKKFDQGNIIIAGIPAKVVKRKITWDRRRPEEFNKAHG